MPDFNMQPSFPIAQVVQGYQRKAELDNKTKMEQEEMLNQSIGAIGTIGKSLLDQKRQVAQALAIKKALIPELDDETARTMDPDQMFKTAAIIHKTADVDQLLQIMRNNMLPKGSAAAQPASPAPVQPATPASPAVGQPGASLPIDHSADVASASPTVPIPVPPPAPAAMPFGGGSTATAPSPTPVPIPAPPLKARMNPATIALGKSMGLFNPNVDVMSTQEAQDAKSVPKGTIIRDLPRTPIEVSERATQFYQREWDKLLKESDPLNASSRTPLGLASRANFQANRALKTLSNPVVTNQEAGNSMADIAAIYQNGSPTEFGMSHQQYDTLYGRVQGIIQQISGKPQDALPDPIKKRLLGVLSDMKETNQALLKQRLDMTEKSKKSVIAHFPDEWKDYRHILEGEQSQYNGLGAASTDHAAGIALGGSDASRLAELRAKKAAGTLK